jgi:hypothetical protein
MRLFFSALKQVASEGKTIVIVSPPYLPYPPALLQHGLDPAQMILVQASDQKDRLWAFEQALRSRSSGAAMIWLAAVDEKHMRRLQLAASEGKGLAIMFRPAAVEEGVAKGSERPEFATRSGDVQRSTLSTGVAKSGRAVLLRHPLKAGSAWAALRLHLFPDEGHLGVRILKRRGGGSTAPMRLYALDLPAFS